MKSVFSPVKEGFRVLPVEQNKSANPIEGAFLDLLLGVVLELIPLGLLLEESHVLQGPSPRPQPHRSCQLVPLPPHKHLVQVELQTLPVHPSIILLAESFNHHLPNTSNTTRRSGQLTRSSLTVILDSSRHD